MSSLDAIVVGAGVSGLTTAVCLAEAGRRVAVRTAAPSAASTSAVAGALWEPYLVESGGRVWDWCKVTLDELRGLAGEPAAGVRLVSGREASRAPGPPPEWGSLVDLRACEPAELPPGFVSGWRFTAPLVDMAIYLGYLERRFLAAGGVVEQRRVGSLAEVAADAPVVVNCAGVAARELVPDPELVPVRGQVVVVVNPGVSEFFAATDTADLTYVLPHPDRVVLGGTAERGATDLEPDPETARRILARCVAIEPRLAGAPVLAHKVGLRPSRPTIRVEEVPLDGGGRLVHNYGHGGAGITVSWGCAREIAALVAG
jgi:D-amino-acid oxidase